MKRSGWLIAANVVVASATLLGETVPRGFVEQILEPTGGKVNRPRGWFYAENHSEESGAFHFNWTLSKEKHKDGQYDTGLRIQYFMGVRKATGKTPKQFILEFLEKKRHEAKKILSDCAPEQEGAFTRVCLETEEGPYRITYSLLWDNVGDDAAVTIAGAKKSEYQKWIPIFNQMRQIKFLDLDYMERKAASEKSKGGKPVQESK